VAPFKRSSAFKTIHVSTEKKEILLQLLKLIANNISLQTTYISLNGLFADGPKAFECLV
jgi:hypothetical protein